MVYWFLRKYNLLIDGMGMPILYTIIKGRESILMKKALLFFGILFLVMQSAIAEENVLQSIEIVPVKDSYNIVLVADKSVDVKKTVQAPNKITLDMKGIRASKNLSTIYNNVSNVDTVMVEPSGNGISLFFQAENAQAASISFDSLAPVVAPTSTKQVKLNSPIESYSPIYREELAQQKTSSLFNKLTEKSNAVKDELRENSTEAADTMNKMFSYGLIGLLAFSVIRLFRRKEPDMKIGLSQSLNEREIAMYRGPQDISSSYMPSEKPFTTVNYGLNAYKKENENPYETEPMTIHNPRLRNYANIPSPAPAQPIVKTSTVTMPKRNSASVNPAPLNQSNPNVDNLKFLESMTAIYEKSGRHDLAQGLKASLTKTGTIK